MQFAHPARLLLGFSLMLFPFVNQLMLAQIPHTLSYQAVLTDNAGTPKPDGMYTITFRLYTALSGGAAIWTEPQTLEVKRGVFSAVLGSITPLGADITFAQPYWLSLQAAPDAEMSPRLPLTSTAYSLAPWTSIGSDLYFSGGNVGIGTTSPQAKLTVVGDAWVTPGGSGGTINFGTPNAETGMTINGNSSNGRADLRFDGNSLKLLASVGTGPPPASNGVVITTDGNVAIGHSVPTTKLDINGKTLIRAQDGLQIVGYQPFLTLTDANTGYTNARVQSANGDLIIYPHSFIGGNPAMVVKNTSGNVGIGTNNPTARLEVIGRTKTGTLEITAGSDLAEPFDTETDEVVEAGSIMVIDALNPGKLKVSDRAYDGRVAGIVSGAGGVKPGITLQQNGVLEGKSLVAIAGRVYCKADAQSSPIEPGDLLTTSEISGHAMKATDRERSHGAVIGKAMSSLKNGTGLVLVLVNLQ